MIYKFCQRCGCTLDPGEANDPCDDCKKEEADLLTQNRPRVNAPMDILALFYQPVKPRGDVKC